MNIESILATMQRAEERMDDLARRLSDASVQKECYAGGWNIHACLCHVSTHGDSMVRILKNAGLAAPESDPKLTALRERWTGANGFDLHGYNDAVAEERRSMSVQDLADALRRDHAKAAPLIKQLTATDLARELKPRVGPWPTLGEALAHMPSAENGHLDDIEAALSRG